MRLVLALALLAISPSIAFAHPGLATAPALLAGFSHPLGGLDHVLAMLAVAIFAGALGGRALWLVPASFLTMMLAGFGMGLTHINLPYVELGIALSSVIIGLAASQRRPLPLAVSLGLVGSFAVLHGHAHGAEMPADANGLLYAAGFLAAMTLIGLTGLAITMTLRRHAGRHGAALIRATAAMCTVSGIGLLTGWI